MKKFKILCCSANEDEDYTREESVIMQTDYDMENEYKVADYDPDSVKKEYLDIFHSTNVANRHILISAFHRKTFHSAILGVTWKPVLGFLFLYWLFQILY